MVLGFISFFLIVSSGPLYNTGPVGNIVNNSNNSLITWIKSYPNDFTGMLIFLPGLVVVPPDFRLAYAFITYCWVSIVPETYIYQFIIQAICLVLTFRANSKDTRVFLMAVAIISYLMGWITFASQSEYLLSPNKALYNTSKGLYSY